jgi:hypothetical protein
MILKKLEGKKVRITFETPEEKRMIRFLYKGKVLKGAYAYKEDDWIEIDFGAYSTEYILFFKEDKPSEIKPKEDIFDFLEENK